jgi:hypothetical protein
MAEQAKQLKHDVAPAGFTALVRDFLAKHYITQVCLSPFPPSAQIWLPTTSGFSQN